MFAWHWLCPPPCAVLGLHTELLVLSSLCMNSDLVVNMLQFVYHSPKHNFFPIMHLLLCVICSLSDRSETEITEACYCPAGFSSILCAREGERCNRNGVTEDYRQVEVKRQEDRQAKLRLRLWVVAEEEGERGGGTDDVMCNNIHALCKCLCAPLVCMCVRALVLRASLLALINNSPVLLVRLPSSLHPLPQLPPLSSLFPLTSSCLCPSPKHHPKKTYIYIHKTLLITHHTLVTPSSTQILHLHALPPFSLRTVGGL